ncbi:hypothetical protein PV350_13985 [Streptomyces sp. PA03-6a]|nr:hypothetical protein [Streptomyces sp. PA03-6a]
MKRYPIPRPTEHAALRRAERSSRALPPVTALLAALLEAHERSDRAAVVLCAHRTVRVALPEVGE